MRFGIIEFFRLYDRPLEATRSRVQLTEQNYFRIFGRCILCLSCATLVLGGDGDTDPEARSMVYNSEYISAGGMGDVLCSSDGALLVRAH